MKLRAARLGVLLAAVLGLMATMIPSASATYVKTVTFTGTAVLGGGLGYPGAPPDNKIPCTEEMTVLPDCVTVKTGPKGEPIVNVKPHGNHATFDFSTVACVKESVSDDPAKKTPGIALCAITASGVVWGFCGLSTGIGVATLTNLGPPPFTKDPATISTEIKFTGVGGTLYVTGGNMTTNVNAVVSAVPTPDPGGTSCTMKTADSFQLTGEAVFKNIT